MNKKYFLIIFLFGGLSFSTLANQDHKLLIIDGLYLNMPDDKVQSLLGDPKSKKNIQQNIQQNSQLWKYSYPYGELNINIVDKKLFTAVIYFRPSQKMEDLIDFSIKYYSVKNKSEEGGDYFSGDVFYADLPKGKIYQVSSMDAEVSSFIIRQIDKDELISSHARIIKQTVRAKVPEENTTEDVLLDSKEWKFIKIVPKEDFIETDS